MATIWRQPRTLDDFGELRRAERKLLEERDTGLPVVLGDGTLPAEDAPEERRVRASFLRWLILGAEGAEGRTHEKGVQVCGAFIENDGPAGGGLDLNGCEVGSDVALFACRFEAAPLLRSARLKGLLLQGSHLPGFVADGLTTTRDVFLKCIESEGEILLRGASIGGTLSCVGAKLRNTDGYALSADRLTTTGSVVLRGIRSDGAIRLLGARIGVTLDCDGADMRNARGNTLNADGLTTNGYVFLRGIESDGEIRLDRVSIGGDLDCDGANMRNARGNTLNAAGATTNGNVFLRGISSDGEIRLIGARIGGDLACDHAKLRKATGNTIDAGRLTTRGSVFLRGIESEGAIRLPGARIGGVLTCDGAKLRKAKGATLSAEGLTTTGSVLLRAIESDGAISLPGARIGGDVACEHSKLRNANGDALIVFNARVEGSLFMVPAEPVAGAIDLRAARLGPIEDNPAGWPDTVRLDRCTYTAFIACPTDAATRIAWLGKDDDGAGFRPQPWEQCAKVLQETGHAADARSVLIEKERRQRAARRKAASWSWGRLLWAGDGLLGLTVRYGRQPMLAFLWLLGFWLLGAAHFSVAAERDAIKPNNAFILRGAEWALCGVPEGKSVFLPSMDKAVAGLREEGETRRACFERQEEAQSYPAFNALIYSADTLLPIVSLEMQEYWIPDDRVRDLGLLARGYLWLHIALGWALSLLAVAGFSGLVKSD